jgi:hypothetical protein
MNRLTDRKTAEALRSNIEGLRRAGIEPDRTYLEYVKLAEYENREEDREKVICSYDPDEWYE